MLKLLMLAALASFAQDTASIDARITEVDGEVMLFAAGEPDGSQVEAGVPLSEGDRLVTSEGASVEIGLDGGSAVRIEEKSEFTFRSGKKAGTLFDLTVGRLLAKIQKLAPGSSLQVRTPTAVAAVRGTEFAVEADAEEAQVAVFDEGRVEVTGDEDSAGETLGPNQETTVMRGGRPAKAAALKRMARHRAFMRGRMRLRMKLLAEKWKGLPPEQREELRRKAMERMRARREKMRDRRQDRRQRRRDERRERRMRRDGGR